MMDRRITRKQAQEVLNQGGVCYRCTTCDTLGVLERTKETADLCDRIRDQVQLAANEFKAVEVDSCGVCSGAP